LYFPDTQEEEKYLVKGSNNNSIVQYQLVAEGGAQVLGLMTKQVKFERVNMAGYMGGGGEEGGAAAANEEDAEENEL
jgi:hypothetical protein